MITIVEIIGSHHLGKLGHLSSLLGFELNAHIPEGTLDRLLQLDGHLVRRQGLDHLLLDQRGVRFAFFLIFLLIYFFFLLI